MTKSPTPPSTSALIQSVLIANRGEIACRVIRTAKRLGIKTIAVYSDADRHSLPVKMADFAVYIGPAPVQDSYLNQNAIISAAKQTQADAIHPGYGFLSENSQFATRCEQEGITFIGPSSQSIELMGNKRAAKLAVMKANVPCVPGYEGEDQNDAALLDAAQNIGFPLLIKATAGGGGRGMRIVQSLNEMAAALASARSEALNAFGSDELILEKYIESPRHIEIQIFADQQGNTVHLGERDCSVQRRHQKVVEESPSVAISDTTRQKMGEAAVAAARACGYVGAGTVEFITDDAEQFYFLEMNTRLQVEHPVTEMVTGIDLVEWQLLVASGISLPKPQTEIQHQGHAIEVRLYAEDPNQQFLPQTGQLHRLDMPHLPSPQFPNARIDHAIESGTIISPFYDPMFGKWIAWGKNRSEAIQQLTTLLEQTKLYGVTHNRAFLLNILKHPEFRLGKAVTTHFIAEHEAELLRSHSVSAIPATLLIAAAMRRTLAGQQSYTDSVNTQRLGQLQRSTALQRQTLMTLQCSDQSYQLIGTWLGEGELEWTVKPVKDSAPNESESKHLVRLKCYDADKESITFTLNGIDHTMTVTQQLGEDGATRLFIDSHLGHLAFEEITFPQIDPMAAAAESGNVLAPMDGKIVALHFEEGDAVEVGDTLMVIEAMKMEHPIKASKAGSIVALGVRLDQQAKRNQSLVLIE